MPPTSSLRINLEGAVGDRVRVARERPDWLQLAEVQVFGDIQAFLTWTPIANGPHYCARA